MLKISVIIPAYNEEKTIIPLLESVNAQNNDDVELEVVVIDDGSLPIRLTPTTTTCRVPPLSRVKLGIGWSRGVARDAEQ